MAKSKMQIMFDNPWATYYTGQTVAGRLVFTLQEPRDIREIKIKFKGHAEVKWSESESYTDSEGKSQTRNVDYQADEVYFENKFIAVKDKSLPAGTHNFDFSTIIPPNVPSSYEGQHGHIRYTVKATWDRPWKFDMESKAAFTVIAPVDLNYSQEARMPMHAEKQKTVGMWCCASGSLSAAVSAPFSGVTPGQSVPLSINVENMTNTSTKEGSLSLRKVVVYRSRHPSQCTKTEFTEIMKEHLPVIGAHGGDTWLRNVPIPSLPATNTVGCSIISIAYEIMVHIPVDGMCLRGIELAAPVLIGTVPLMYVPTGSGPAPPVITAPTPGQIGWSANNYPDMPPPTFEESAFGKAETLKDADDNDHIQGVGGWVPKYPMFNFTPTAPPIE